MINWLKKKISRLKLKIWMYSFRRLLDLTTLFVQAIRFRFRYLCGFKLVGHDIENDELTLKVINHLLGLQVLSNFSEYYEKVDRTVFEDEKLLQLIDAYVILFNLVSKQEFQPNVDFEIKPKDPFIENLTDTSTRSIKQQLKRFLRNDIDELIDRSTYKFDFSLSDLISYITLTSTLLLIGGFIYNKLFYTLHGVTLKHIFGPADYLFAAAEQLESALISGLAALIGYFSFLVDFNENRGYYITNDVVEKRRKRLNIVSIVVFFLSLSLFWFNGRIAFQLFYLPFYLVILYLVDKLVYRHFQSPREWFPVILFMACFLFNVNYNSLQNYFYPRVYETVEFYGDNENLIVDPIFQPIGSSANYFILKDSINNIQILSRGEVKKIKYDDLK